MHNWYIPPFNFENDNLSSVYGGLWKSFYYKVGCVFPMLTWSEFHIGQYSLVYIVIIYLTVMIKEK